MRQQQTVHTQTQHVGKQFSSVFTGHRLRQATLSAVQPTHAETQHKLA